MTLAARRRPIATVNNVAVIVTANVAASSDHNTNDRTTVRSFLFYGYQYAPEEPAT